MRYTYFIILALVLLTSSCRKKETPTAEVVIPSKTLVFSKTNGYRHESIADGIKMLNTNASKWEINVTATENPTDFTNSTLAQYKLIVLLSNTGNNLDDNQKAALQKFVQNGGRILAIHAATDAEYDWTWYGEMLGARFKNHPAIQEAVCETVNIPHPSTTNINSWIHTDEWYNFVALQPDNKVVMTVNENTYTGGEHGALHPISWYREYDGGRIFYTGLGHTAETYTDSIFLKHMEGAIKWLLEK